VTEPANQERLDAASFAKELAYQQEQDRVQSLATMIKR
jgi:UDP-N-acetylglucosamine 1-carboxyvinyltransferase